MPSTGVYNRRNKCDWPKIPQNVRLIIILLLTTATADSSEIQVKRYEYKLNMLLNI